MSMRIWRLCRHPGKKIFMMTYREKSSKNVLKLHERGMFQDMFPDTSANEIKNLLYSSPQCVYAGFDPTANSLHVGNLLVLMNLLHWQRGGHQVLALLGGATGLIGDPSHRKKERLEMKQFLLDENLCAIKENIETIFDNHLKYFWKDAISKLKPIQIVNNIDWYKNINVIDFNHKIGKHFRLGTMMGRSSVESRLNSEGGMSFSEFSYQVFQAYDWLHLLKNHNCKFQIGGADQMGNIMAGHELISRKSDHKVYALTLPLITAEGGKKFGKSLGNAVWLSPKNSSSFQLYQYFVRSTDNDVEKYLKLFTFLPLEKITEIMTEHKNEPEKRIAQKILASEVTMLVHGENGLDTAKKMSRALYSNSIELLSVMDSNEITQVFADAHVIDLLPEAGLTVYDLAMKAQCFKTHHDAQRIIEAGGFYVNHQRITNVSEIVTAGIHILPNNVTVLRTGKKTYHIVRWLS